MRRTGAWVRKFGRSGSVIQIHTASVNPCHRQVGQATRWRCVARVCDEMASRESDRWARPSAENCAKRWSVVLQLGFEPTTTGARRRMRSHCATAAGLVGSSEGLVLKQEIVLLLQFLTKLKCLLQSCARTIRTRRGKRRSTRWPASRTRGANQRAHHGGFLAGLGRLTTVEDGEDLRPWVF